jgi:tetratricopeptide (TPR) repeat protein
MAGIVRRSGIRQRVGLLLQHVLEGGVLVLVVASPWMFGGVDPDVQAFLTIGVALLVAVWGVRVLVRGWVRWPRCAITSCLAALFLFAALQLLSLPLSIVAALSPATSALRERLLPRSPEVLPEAERTESVAASTLSLYPQATRQQAVQLLAILIVFAVVRSELASTASLRRLSLAALGNGILLALFAVCQHFTSAPGTIYWSVTTTDGVVFGPFVYKNHFAFYINLCIGLGLGLLLCRLASLDERRRIAGAESHLPPVDEATRQPMRFLYDPPALWISLALGLMATSVAFSLSRGGLLALLAAGVVCLTFPLARSARFWRVEALLLPAAVALALLTWFGLPRLEARWASLWGNQGLLEGRLALWPRCLQLARDFPLLGTGYGTFDYVEPLHRTDASDAGWSYGHAHNEYLEALVEGGLLRLAVSMLAVVLVFVQGVRACRRLAGQPAGGLALGALFAFTTLVVHSALDFGLHAPAIALLAATVVAQLCGVAESEGNGQSVACPAEHAAPRSWSLGAVVGAVLALTLSVFLGTESWRMDRVWQLQRMLVESPSEGVPSGPEERLEQLESAVTFDPMDARLHYQLAEAYAERFDSERNAAKARVLAGAVGETVLNAAALGGCGPAPAAAVTWPLVVKGRLAATTMDSQFLVRHLLPALHHYLRARDLCPLRARPHLRIAGYAHTLERADSRSTYLERVKFLAPADPELWYRCGVLEGHDGNWQEAWQSWRRSLELSDRYLDDIVDQTAGRLSPGDMLERLLPDNPRMLVRAAAHLWPQPEAVREQQAFLKKALSLLDTQQDLTPEDYRLKATVLSLLGQPAAAVNAYEAALLRDPMQAVWRFELAQLLASQGRVEEAIRELLVVLAQQPAHAPARQLLQQVTGERARKRAG